MSRWARQLLSYAPVAASDEPYDTWGVVVCSACVLLSFFHSPGTVHYSRLIYLAIINSYNLLLAVSYLWYWLAVGCGFWMWMFYYAPRMCTWMNFEGRRGRREGEFGHNLRAHYVTVGPVANWIWQLLPVLPNSSFNLASGHLQRVAHWTWDIPTIIQRNT